MKRTLAAFIQTLTFLAALNVSAESRLINNLEAGKKQTAVTFGTSLTAVGAWVDQLREVLEQQYPGQITLINGAQGGANSDWGRGALEEKVLKHHPDTVFIEFAVNDAVGRRNTNVEHARSNLVNMIDRILATNPDCEIILMVMNPPVAKTSTDRPNLAAYNQMYRDVAEEKNFQLIDHYPVWEEILNKDPARYIFFVPDGIHPVRQGALDVITPTMIKALGMKEGQPELNKNTPCWNYLFKGMMDKDKNWEVSRGEYEVFWADNFDTQDDDKNGKLIPSEYVPPVLFKYVDADNDGEITLDEYQTVYTVHFDTRDTNKDEVLSKDEFWGEK